MWSDNAGVATEKDETTDDTGCAGAAPAIGCGQIMQESQQKKDETTDDNYECCSPESRDHLGLILVAAADQRNSATEIQFFSLRGHVLECAMSGAFE